MLQYGCTVDPVDPEIGMAQLIPATQEKIMNNDHKL